MFGTFYKKNIWVGIGGTCPVPTLCPPGGSATPVYASWFVDWIVFLMESLSRQGLEKGRFNGHVQHENLSSLTSRQRSGQQHQDHNFRFLSRRIRHIHIFYSELSF